MNQSQESPQSDRTEAATPPATPLSLRWLSFYASIIALIGGLSIRFVLNQIYPSLISEILLFGLIFITTMALVIPIAAYFNHRFAAQDWRAKDPRRLIRQGVAGGTLIVAVTYLQLIQALDGMMFIVLGGVFVLMEIFFMTRP